MLEFFTGIFVGIKGIQFVMEDLQRDMIVGRTLEFDATLAGIVGLCGKSQPSLATCPNLILTERAEREKNLARPARPRCGKNPLVFCWCPAGEERKPAWFHSC